MPVAIRRLTTQGVIDVKHKAKSLQDAARVEPREGVYTVSNTYNRTRTLLLNAHLDRLEDSARRQGIPLSLDRARLRSALRQLILDSDYGDVRFRISVSSAAPDESILSVEPYQAPSAELIQQGARCMTSMAARQNPAAKSISWIRRRQAIEATKPAGVYEMFLLDARGNLLEGVSSNVYVVLGGALYTADSGVLPGVSRMIVFEICEAIVPRRQQAANMAEVERFSEVFLSSSSRGLIPVVELDGKAIGDGRVGPITLALRDAYQRWVAAHLEEL